MYLPIYSQFIIKTVENHLKPLLQIQQPWRIEPVAVKFGYYPPGMLYYTGLEEWFIRN